MPEQLSPQLSEVGVVAQFRDSEILDGFFVFRAVIFILDFRAGFICGDTSAVLPFMDIFCSFPFKTTLT